MKAALAIAAAVVACKPAARPAVAFLAASPHARDLHAFERRAAERGLDVIAADAGGDAARQLGQVEDALAREARVLVVEPADPAAAARYVRLAHARGAKLVAYDRAIASAELDAYVAHDRYQTGVLEAAAALAATGRRGRYLLVSDAGEVTRGYQHTLAPYVARGDVVATELADPRDLAGALARGRVDAILASDAQLAHAATAAVAAAGVPHVFVAGAEPDPAGVDELCAGKQAVEIVEDVDRLATAAADVAARLAAGKPAGADGTIELAGARVPLAAERGEVVTPDTCRRRLAEAR